jgi:hypothetical protein
MANEFIARNGIVSKSNLIVSGSLTALNTITAQTLVVQTITSSISSITGSTNFGTLSSNTHTFTGSILTSGSIGIGTASPAKALEIISNTSQDGIKISGTSNPRLTIIDTTNNVQFDALTTDTEAVLRTDTNHPLHFSTNGTLRLTITSTGSAIFAVSANKRISTYTPSTWTGISDYVTSGVGWQFTRPNDDVLAHAIFAFNGTSTNNLAISSRSDLVIATGGGLGEAAERLRITSDGKLKLTSTTTGGTNLDMYLLENDGLFINSNEGATARNIYFQVGGTEVMRINGATRDLYLGSSTIDKNSRFVTYGSTTDANYYAFRAFSNGSDVLLGIRNDGLLVTGTLSLSPYNYSVSGRAVYVNSGGVVGYNASTRESKSNINSLQDISWIHNLNPVTFNKRKKDNEGNYTDEVYDELDYGLIADEVEKINTDFVFYDTNKDGTKKLAGVGYEKLIPVLIKAIQELTARVQELENK